MWTEAPEDATTETPPPDSGPGAGGPKPSRRERRREKRREQLNLQTGESVFRHRVVPRTVIGIVTMLLAGAVGFAFGGTILYAYYQSRLDKVEQRVSDYIEQFEGRYEAAREQIGKDRDEAKEEIRREIEPIKQLSASGATLAAIVNAVKDSTYLVETQNDFGEPSVGSAFVLTSDSEKSYLVTSLSVVKSATRRPGPAINLRKGEEVIPAQLHTWQDERDLALLIVNKGSLPRLKWASPDEAVELGSRVFIVSGIGAAGGGITQGLVSDVSAHGIQHDAGANTPYAGGPVLNSKREVIGVATPQYKPLGFTSDTITYAAPIRSTCEQILQCPANATEAGGAGERR
jgi:S1-C subfamily serine protease